MMTPDELSRIANSGGYGSGKRARDLLHQRAETRRMLPAPEEMNEMTVDTEIDGLVASLGNDVVDGKDWFLNASGYGLTSDMETARMDGLRIAAVWNAYRTGILVLSEGDE